MEYFQKSDQILTFSDLSTNLSHSSDILSLGMLLQKMPECSEDYLSSIYQSILEDKTWKEIKLGIKSIFLMNMLKIKKTY